MLESRFSLSSIGTKHLAVERRYNFCSLRIPLTRFFGTLQAKRRAGLLRNDKYFVRYDK
jgi:hypothetical protein